MDPTLAALIGAAFGAVVTAFSPWLNGRAQHSARRREVMREAYLQGMRVIAAFPRAQRVADLERVREELFEARLHIRLVGSRRAFNKFKTLADEVDRWIGATLQTAATMKRVTNLEPVVGSVIPEADRLVVGRANEAFVVVARHDMGMEDRPYVRTLRRLRHWLGKKAE